MPSYKLRPETVVDIIEQVPEDRVDTLMRELAEMIKQAKLSYDLCKSLDPNAKAEIRTPFIWEDDGTGEIAVTHSIDDRVFLKTTKHNPDIHADREQLASGDAYRCVAWR